MSYPSSDPGSPEHRDVIPANPRSMTDGPTDPSFETVNRSAEHVERVERTNGGFELRERAISTPEGLEQREELTRNRAAERRLMIFRIERLIGLVFGFIEVLIAVRVVLRLIGANPGNGFVDFVYGLSSVFLAPFFGIVGSPSAGRYVLEVPSIIAIAIYALVAWGLVSVVQTFAIQETTRTYSSYNRYRG